MVNRSNWNGIVVGYTNGKTAKGIMQYLGKDEDGLSVWRRSDGREYCINIARELAALMIDPLNIPGEYTKEQVMATETAQKWYRDNTYQGNKE